MMSESSNEDGSIVGEDKLVLIIEGDENRLFTMSVKIKGNQFKTMVDSSTPVTIFEIDDIKGKMKPKTLFYRKLPEHEEYLDFNGRKLNLLGYIFFHREVGERELHKARILIGDKGAKSLIGRD